ncbi:DUF4198 domain-containing protein [Noviherbaspirillum saxi]|uniref:DUF4198 domain-containing protein n=1 Tax=Noviherbaspirillum saxi TaxID=2320863 RepID=A0A3A3FUB7_9BURK|nr:DUF4198 domain-containing protein [Noviherbaspirillum saxi]RJF99807.1 DUF4198 domain-containing protein [Noviherbaspirillum saxi]
MNNSLRAMCAAFAVLASLPAAAHEFWMMAKPFSPAVGAPVAMTLHVGEYFSGDLIPFAATQSAALLLYSKGKPRDLVTQLPPETPLPELQMVFPNSGTYMLAFDGNPNEITLSADKFHAYLHEEGLDAIIAQRESAGNATAPGRERYRRHVKTLLRVGGKSDGSFAALTGQRLEIVPTSDPLAKAAGDTLGLTLFFDSKPLPNALVKAWHQRNGQTLMIRARTGADGKVSFGLPYAGAWMISVVHMVPVTDTPDIDWDSFWGNLTFELAGRKAGR